ncbi:MAG: DUF4214 domain-containing protein [Pseudomonadota bacterium]
MTITRETTQADFFSSNAQANRIVVSGPGTYVGRLDQTQNTGTLLASETTALGLDSTTVRADLYEFQVDGTQLGGDPFVQIAVSSENGATIGDLAVTLYFEGSTTNFDTVDRSTLTPSSSAKGTDLEGAVFPVGSTSLLGGVGTVYALIAADISDQGDYIISFGIDNFLVGNDTVTGTSQDDFLDGYFGSDEILGGLGRDTSIYHGDKKFYDLYLGDDIQVADRRSNDVDTLKGIEALSFDDGVVDLDHFRNVLSLSEDQLRSFAEIYIAYFNRAPDAEGLYFWANAFATGTSLSNIAELFAQSAEAQALYPSTASSSNFVEAIYSNVLGRLSDAVGKAFWVSVLDSGDVSRGTFVLEILKGARAPAEPGASQAFLAQKAADVKYLNEKVDVGLYYGAYFGLSKVDRAKDVMAEYDGTLQGLVDAKDEANLAFYEASFLPDEAEFQIRLVGLDNPLDYV